MKKKHPTAVLLILIAMSILVLIRVNFSHAQPSVEFEISRTVWGDDPNSPVKAYPGDVDQSLTVEVQNLSPNETIKGVKAVLMMEGGPFADVYGSTNATATGVPEIGDLLNPTDEIKPKGFFTLTFALDISDEAVPQSFLYDMTLDYSVNVSDTFLEGELKILNVEFTLSKIDSAVACSVSPQTVEKGELVDVTGSITPTQDNATVNLHYWDLNGSTSVHRVVTTSSDGSYRDSFRPTVEGQWRVNASWIGDAQHNSDWTLASFEVRLDVILKIIASDSHLTGGYDNQINLTLVNEGQVELSMIDVTISIPSPMILFGEDSWNFEQLKSGDSTWMIMTIFVPESVIGSTYTGTVTSNYRDHYGETNTESQTLGLIMIGKIELSAYDMTASQQSAASPRVSVTATLLNKGNVAARYVNASINANSILDLTAESTTYIGEVEENAPTPFTLVANLKDKVEDGTYSIDVTIWYRNDKQEDQHFDLTIPFNLMTTSGNQNGSDDNQSLGPYGQLLISLLLILAAASVAIILYRRRAKLDSGVKRRESK